MIFYVMSFVMLLVRLVRKVVCNVECNVVWNVVCNVACAIWRVGHSSASPKKNDVRSAELQESMGEWSFAKLSVVGDAA